MAKLKRTWNEKYELIEELGEGGNAQVYRVREITSGNHYALKELKKLDSEKKQRFLDEIQIMEKASAVIEGIIPIVDSDESELWYVMPVAVPIIKRLSSIRKDDRFEEIKKSIIQLAGVLVALQEKEIAHRDIKPANLYYLDGRYCFGDFGLVDFPENDHDLTDEHRNMGAKFTIAPEMMRHPKEADGLKADIYSLAKTYWMLLTGDEYGFEGTYDFRDKSHSLRYRNELRKLHLVELEKIIEDATDNNPDSRPSATELLSRIKEWVEICKDFDQCQKSEWKAIETMIFDGIAPESAVWRDTSEIVEVLNCISSMPVYNHLLYSDKGGLDFQHASMATEEGLIDIIVDFGFVNRLLPKELRYEGFKERSEWNYFLLTTNALNPIYDAGERESEILTEDFPGHYVDCRDFDYGVYDYDSGVKLPESAIQIRRYCRGSFLIVMKSGPYNSIHSTYDGRHGDCNPDAFRDYICRLMQVEKSAVAEGLNPERVLNMRDISANPFKSMQDERDEDFWETIRAEEAIKTYIRDNMLYWSLPQPENTVDGNKEAKIFYYIEYNNSDGGDIFDVIKREIYCVGTQCNIVKISKDNIEKCALFADINSAIKYKEELELFIISKCREAGLETSHDCHINPFNIRLKRGSIPPVHLFTEEEIRQLMVDADDRRGNVLVVDEDGYAHIIPDTSDADYYPVRLESWDARNNYVGKYSKLGDLRGAYLRALECWHDYLETGQHQYTDYTELKDDREIVEKIRKIM